jgi:hypothetical protein
MCVYDGYTRQRANKYQSQQFLCHRLENAILGMACELSCFRSGKDEKKTFFRDMALRQRGVSSRSFETRQWPHLEGFRCLLQYFNISQKVRNRLSTDATSYQLTHSMKQSIS